ATVICRQSNLEWFLYHSFSLLSTPYIVKSSGRFQNVLNSFSNFSDIFNVSLYIFLTSGTKSFSITFFLSDLIHSWTCTSLFKRDCLTSSRLFTVAFVSTLHSFFSSS